MLLSPPSLRSLRYALCHPLRSAAPCRPLRPASSLASPDDYEPPARPPREPRVADVRSDTVTKPTAEMLLAMMDAPVGDDVYADDPTVRRLEREVAEILGKDAALFCPSGTMSNLLAIAAQVRRGEEIILGDEQHVFVYEGGGASALNGIVFHTLPQLDDGTFQLRARSPPAGGAPGRLAALRSLEYAIATRSPSSDQHYAPPALVAIENTHNRCGGAVLPQAWVDECAAITHAAGLRLHMDGARLLNAAAASGLTPARIVRDCDSVSLCLSKGLGAPIGSVMAADSGTVQVARKLRKTLGGGMRQVGVIAAAGLIALREGAKKLPSDHSRARTLARGLAAIPGLRVDAPTTNIIVFDLAPSLSAGHFVARAQAAAAQAPTAGSVPGFPEACPARMQEALALDPAAISTASAFCKIVEALSRARMAPYGSGHSNRMRAVVHHQVTEDDVELILKSAAAAVALLGAL